MSTGTVRQGGDVHFVGLDLAWGRINQTGIAAVDAGGSLVFVDAANDDDAIINAVEPYVSADCLVGIDAPLIVTNATGQRPAERALNADFARFQAGAHPANTTMPVFAAGLRGARIADALGLQKEPHTDARRRAIEVYPHAASVALFRLGRTLKYKRGEVDSRRSELLRLIALVESLASATPPLNGTDLRAWKALRHNVETATRQVQLNRAEDPIDAVVCAYIAMFAHHRPNDVTTYGDAETGYVVTPTLPPDLTPLPRAAAVSRAALRGASGR
jgi:predicted RNase H-like nuclease